MYEEDFKANFIEDEYGRIFRIIQKYIQLILNSFEIDKERAVFESYLTQTNIVAKDFFDSDNEIYTCNGDNKVLVKDFGNPIILFNDLKNSTKLLEELEKHNLECLYIAYIQYSSQMLADILDLFGGNMIECTGDGNYSIFIKNNLDEKIMRREGNNFLKSVCFQKSLISSDWQIYINKFDTLEINSILKSKYSCVGMYKCSDNRWYRHRVCNKDNSCYIRDLFFKIFALLNIEVNKKIPYRIKNKFLTRIGCKQGNCKITRIQVDSHIKQDKLIGSIVHQTAHQASGK